MYKPNCLVSRIKFNFLKTQLDCARLQTRDRSSNQGVSEAAGVSHPQRTRAGRHHAAAQHAIQYCQGRGESQLHNVDFSGPNLTNRWDSTSPNNIFNSDDPKYRQAVLTHKHMPLDELGLLFSMNVLRKKNK